MTFPARVATAFIMGHTKIAFALLKTLFDWPPQGCCSVQFCIGDVLRRIRHKIFNGSILVFADIQPDFFSWLHITTVSVFTAGYNGHYEPLRHDGALRTFSQCYQFLGGIRIFRYTFDADWLDRPYWMLPGMAAALAPVRSRAVYARLFQKYLFLCVGSRKIPYSLWELQAVQKGVVTSVRSITTDPLCLEPSGFKRMVEKVLGDVVLCKEVPLCWKSASVPQVLAGVLKPLLGDIKLIIHQTVAGVSGIGKEYSNLAVFPFAQPAAVLPLYPNGMRSFLYEAGIINRQHGA